MTEIFKVILITLLILCCAAIIVSYSKSYFILKPSKRKMQLNYWPDQFKLVFESIDFRTSDSVDLKGWFIPAISGETNKTIIFCHGWGSNRGEVLKDTYFLAEHGFNLFYFDFRASGESKGEISSVGYLEIKDLESAIEFLKHYKPHAFEKIGILGISMGGSVATYAASKYDEIKCVLLESTFYSYSRVVANWSWSRMKIPYYPLVPLTLLFVRLKLATDPELFSTVHYIDRLSVPVLFINGDHDDLVPVKDVQILFEKCKSSKKDLSIIIGASHGKCAEVGGQEYREKVFKFFIENL
jgi:pimeloyl-ACP methyl ester carboxylesterase